MKKTTNLEKLLLAENKEEEALLKEIVRSEPTNVVACLRLGNILREKGYYIDALKLHQSLLVETSGIPLDVKRKIYISVIKDYLKAGRPKLALSFANDLWEIGGEDAQLLESLSEVYQELSRWKEAIKIKQKVLKLTKGSDDRGLAILYAFRGNSLVKEGNKKEGLKCFKEALKLDKFCLPGLLFMGDFYYEDRNVDESIKLWERILNDIPDYGFLAFERLQNAYYAKHDLSKLESLCASFLTRNPEDVKVLMILSEIYEKKGKDKEAIEMIERAREVEPQNIAIRKKLFKLYYENKQYKDMFREGEEIASISAYKAFRCRKCGARFEEFKFKCPSCKSWLAIR